MDEKLTKAWRAWRSDPSPENALEWAILQARTLDTGPSETPLDQITWNNYTLPNGDTIEDHVLAAVSVYFGREADEVVVGELSWLTQCHFWLLGTRPGPAAIAMIGKFYADHDMELAVGDETRAATDYEQATEEGSVNNLRREIRRLRSENDRARRESVSGVLDQLREAQKEIAKLNKDLESKEGYLKMRNSEIERLRKEAQKKNKELKADLCKLANLEKSNSILRQENDRLARLLQEKSKP